MTNELLLKAVEEERAKLREAQLCSARGFVTRKAYHSDRMFLGEALRYWKLACANGRLMDEDIDIRAPHEAAPCSSELFTAPPEGAGASVGSLKVTSEEKGDARDEDMVWTRPTTGLPERWKRLPWIHEYVQNTDPGGLSLEDYVVQYLEVLSSDAVSRFFPSAEDVRDFQSVMSRLQRQTQMEAELQ